MPLLHQAMFGALGLNREAVKLAREADGEIADVDHFLHFAFGFDEDFAHLKRNESREIGFDLAKRVAESANRFATDRSGNRPPFQKSFMSAGNRSVVIL